MPELAIAGDGFLDSHRELSVARLLDMGAHVGVGRPWPAGWSLIALNSNAYLTNLSAVIPMTMTKCRPRRSIPATKADGTREPSLAKNRHPRKAAALADSGARRPQKVGHKVVCSAYSNGRL
jgi:hypothetical protein